MHSCNDCSYTSNRMYNLKVHIKNKHENHATPKMPVQQNEMQNNRAPVTMSIGENVEPATTSVFVGNNVPTAPTTMYTQPIQIGSNESGGVEVYQDHSYLQNQNNTSVISKEDYDHALDCINGWKNAHDSWKNAHDNLARSNQTGLVENRNWQMAHQKEVEEKH